MGYIKNKYAEPKYAHKNSTIGQSLLEIIIVSLFVRVIAVRVFVRVVEFNKTVKSKM
jgi:hypothetical protein